MEFADLCYLVKVAGFDIERFSFWDYKCWFIELLMEEMVNEHHSSEGQALACLTRSSLRKKQGGWRSVIYILVGAYFADAYMGKFKMLLIGSTSSFLLTQANNQNAAIHFFPFKSHRRCQVKNSI
ncbi:hypothetical protein VNO80_07229 [Phaseolus coccineus]|uniref:Uncharacterized protein n=1 Tax=Phaseolus coccineus TaxID=3886 RepID=A0AAN9NNR1_PHACN